MSLPEMTCTVASASARHVARTGTAHLVRGLLDRARDLGVEAVRRIDDRGGLLEHAERLDERWRQALCRAADVEVLEGAAGGLRRPSRRGPGRQNDVPLGLGAPVPVRWDLELAESVGLGAEAPVGLCLRERACSAEARPARTIRRIEEEKRREEAERG
jgi:hypothetical protein